MEIILSPGTSELCSFCDERQRDQIATGSRSISNIVQKKLDWLFITQMKK
mgnify:CR=1 FL=1